MIVICVDDILNVEAELLINPANGRGYMGGFIGRFIQFPGVAERIHFKDSSIERLAKRYCQTHKPCAGDVFHTPVKKLAYTKGVLHAVTMEKPGQNSSLETVVSCVKQILNYCQKHNIQSVALPLLGCGTGKLNEADVYAIYNRYLTETSIVFYLVNRHGFSTVSP